jgi:hypothetical protein
MTIANTEIERKIATLSKLSCHGITTGRVKNMDLGGPSLNSARYLILHYLSALILFAHLTLLLSTLA